MIIAKFRESSTFVLVVASLAVLNYKWLTSTEPASLLEYAQASGVLMAIWLGREWRTAHYGKKVE